MDFNFKTIITKAIDLIAFRFDANINITIILKFNLFVFEIQVCVIWSQMVNNIRIRSNH